MEEPEKQKQKKFQLSDLKPRNAREWTKFFANLLIVIFFIYVLWYASFAFREGFDAGMAKCIGQHMTNFSWNISTSINISP
jgi:hypothetical protein